MKDIRQLRLLARRLRHRIGHLKFYADAYCLGAGVCQPACQTRRLTIALSGFECASLMWAHYCRLKEVLAEIRRRLEGQ